jgi:hypothetical protein
MTTTLRDLLEVFGALDKAVGQSDNPAVASTVDSFLPNFSANTGWYNEIEKYFFAENAQLQPDLGKACSRIGQASRDAAANRAAHVESGDDPDQRAPRPALTRAQKSRLLYGLTTAARMHQVGETNMTSMSDEDLMGAYIEALAALGSEDEPYDSRREKASEHFEDFWNRAERCTGRGHFETWRAQTANNTPLVDTSLQAVPLCKATVVTIDSVPVVVVDTNLSTPDRTFNEVTSICNPFNWNENYPDFFISMQECGEPERTDGWFRVLEKVGFRGLGGLELKTALKYFPTIGERRAHIDYDLDDPTPGKGDGKVIVDRGFINIEVDNKDGDPDQRGVRARTRKVVHIGGLSPYAQQRLVCLTGYGTASKEFLFTGRADAKSPYPHPFVYYEGEKPQDDPPSAAPDKSTHVAATAVKLWTESAQGLVSDYFEFAEKWMDGRLKINDVADYSSQLTGRLVSAPLEFWERVNEPRHLHDRPRRASDTGGDTQQGGEA